MSRIISIANRKGGVGKTTSTANLGAALNILGYKVLLIDLDSQKNLSQYFRFLDERNNVYGALRGQYPLRPTILAEGFHAISSTKHLAGAESELLNEMNREYFLKDLIEPLKNNYDYVLIDCPPSLGLLAINALAASDEVLIPLQAEFFALDGLTEILDLIKIIQKRTNVNVRIKGLFVTMYDKRNMICEETLAALKTHYDKFLLKTIVRVNTTLRDAQPMGLSIFAHKPNSSTTPGHLRLGQVSSNCIASNAIFLQ